MLAAVLPFNIYSNRSLDKSAVQKKNLFAIDIV